MLKEEKNNGHKKEVLSNEKVISSSDIGGGLPPSMSLGQMGEYEQRKELPSALNMLAHPGTSPAELGMRTIYADEDEALAISFAEARAEAYADAEHLNFYHKLKSNKVSLKGIGRNQLTSAIIGQREHEENKGGIGNWLQRQAFGEKKNG